MFWGFITEQLFAAGRKLFGDGYSGLEYDYRGLLRLYQQTSRVDRSLEYSRILQEWNQIRDQSRNDVPKPLELEHAGNMDGVIESFFATFAS